MGLMLWVAFLRDGLLFFQFFWSSGQSMQLWKKQRIQPSEVCHSAVNSACTIPSSWEEEKVSRRI